MSIQSVLSEGGRPLISVVICTHNRAKYLAKTIASVLSQDFPPRHYEVIVVDNASTDHTRKVVREFRQTKLIRYLFEEQLGLCNARNAGWRAAAGTYVAYLDDDAVASPGWLAAIREAFETFTPKPGVVGGRVDPVWAGQRPHWLSEDVALTLTIVDWGPIPKPIEDINREWLGGANLAVPVAVLAEVGGFHPWLDRIGKNMLSSGDVFLQMEIMQRGYPCLYHPGIAVKHLVPAARLEQRWFFRRFYWQGISDAVMELILESPSPGRRLWRAAGRAGRLLTSRRKLAVLFKATDDPLEFTEKCVALIDLGHIAGLLGAARH